MAARIAFQFLFIAVHVLLISSASGLRLFQATGPIAKTAGGTSQPALLGPALLGPSGTAITGPAGGVSAITPATSGTTSASGTGTTAGKTKVTVGGVVSAAKGKGKGKKRAKQVVWHRRNGNLPGYDVAAADCPGGASPCKVCKSLPKAKKQCAKSKTCKSVAWSYQEGCGYLKTENKGLAFLVSEERGWTVFIESV